MVLEKLKSIFDGEGFKFSIFKAGHLNEIKNEMHLLLTKGLLDKDVYDTYLDNFRYDCENVLKNAKSVIIVAVPQNKSTVHFTYRQRKIETILPPQYAYPGIDKKVYDILNHVFIQNNYKVQQSRMPLKLLAAMSGLCKYGRNNICYIPEAGSFLRLTGYITDFDSDLDNWTGIKIMDSCKSCSLCADKCPTKAIDKSKYLIDAHKCITHFNEWEKAIPDWIQPQWHNSLVGCMECQNACPHNKKLLALIDKNIEFDEAESEMILDKTPLEGLPPETKAKLNELGAIDYYNMLSRNIKLLLNNM